MQNSQLNGSFIQVSFFIISFLAMEMKEKNIVTSFNVVKTEQFCSLHFHEGKCVGEKPHECV